MPKLPFSIFKRSGRRFYYVQFKCQHDDGYLPAISTKKETDTDAIAVAFQWLSNGIPVKQKKAKRNCPVSNPDSSGSLDCSNDSVDGKTINISLKEITRELKNSNLAEAELICEELKRQGLIKTFVIAESEQDIDFTEFLKTFWDYSTSPYIKEKLRKKHSIHKDYAFDQKLIVKKYWEPYFQGQLLGNITNRKLDKFIDDLSDVKILSRKQLSNGNESLAVEKNLSSGRKNKIIRAGVIPLRWAFAKEIIAKDITRGITWFSEQSAERNILTPEIAQAIFLIGWEDERCLLANMVAAVTGLRAGEIQGLQVQDLGRDRLYIRHSWSSVDKLKLPKTNRHREVELPFPFITERLLSLAHANPHGANMNSFVFWAKKSSSKPIEGCLFVKGLRTALLNIGMTSEFANVYHFHGWRHFFTTYMISRLEKKLLKSQTGHKTDAMLNLYGEHLAEGDREKIRQAQHEAFGGILPACPVPLLQANLPDDK